MKRQCAFVMEQHHLLKGNLNYFFLFTVKHFGVATKNLYLTERILKTLRAQRAQRVNASRLRRLQFHPINAKRLPSAYCFFRILFTSASIAPSAFISPYALRFSFWLRLCRAPGPHHFSFYVLFSPHIRWF